MFEQKLMDLGLPYDDIRFRLSYCQGDGVAFYGRVHDIIEVLEKSGQWEEEKIKKLEEIIDKVDPEFEIEKSIAYIHYDHENTMLANASFVNMDEITAEEEEFLLEVEKWLTKYAKGISRELKEVGYREFDYRDSEEYIAEMCGWNDIWFTEDGSVARF